MAAARAGSIYSDGRLHTVTCVSGTNVLLGSLIGNQYSGSIIPSSNMSPAGPPAIDFAAPQGDSNSYIDWRLSEATGATIINNAVPGGVGATLTVNYSTNGNATLGKVGIFQNCAYFNGAALTSNNPGPVYTATGVAPTFTTISVYGWVFLANQTSGYQWLFGKQYDNGDWVSPNAGVFRFYYTNAGDGTWVVVIRPSEVLKLQKLLAHLGKYLSMFGVFSALPGMIKYRYLFQWRLYPVRYWYRI